MGRSGPAPRVARGARHGRQRGLRRPAGRPRSAHAPRPGTRGPRSSLHSPSKPKVSREGVFWAPAAQSDDFLVDLRKAERDCSPTTMYRHHAIKARPFPLGITVDSDRGAARREHYIERGPRIDRPSVRARAHELRARDAAVRVPRFGPLRRVSRRAPGRLQVASARADAGRALRDRPRRGGGLTGLRALSDSPLAEARASACCGRSRHVSASVRVTTGAARDRFGTLTLGRA
jgi:hypothetical protein